MIRRMFASTVVLGLSSACAFAQFRTVTVENANSNPVPTNILNMPPVTLSGTVDANITNRPNVNATITGTPSVSVTGTPTVSVTNLPTGTAGPAATTVVLTRNVDEPAPQVFQTVLQCNTAFGSGPTSCSASLNVPAGKELVIEYLYFNASESGGSSTQAFQLAPTAGGISIPYAYSPGVRLFSNVPISEHLVRLYADPGSTLLFTGFENSNAGSVSFVARISGHLVNVP